MIKFSDFPDISRINIYGVSTLATVAIQNKMPVISLITMSTVFYMQNFTQ